MARTIRMQRLLACVGLVVAALRPAVVPAFEAVPRSPAAFVASERFNPVLALPVALEPQLRLDPLQTETPPPSPLARRGVLVPALLSAVVPGAGEIASGHIWNGLPLVAAEVAVWFGYAHYDSEGNRMRGAYEAFAEKHWAYDRWQTNLEEHYNVDDPADPVKWYDPLRPPHHCDCSPPFIPKEEDPHEYYENAGKYRHFYPGWEQWTYNPNDPANSDSPLRLEYIGLRDATDNNFANASRMLGVAALTRVVSVLQTIWLVRRDANEQALQLRPVRVTGRGAGLKLSLRY